MPLLAAKHRAFRVFRNKTRRKYRRMRWRFMASVLDGDSFRKAYTVRQLRRRMKQWGE
jgi:hypothetical protein